MPFFSRVFFAIACFFRVIFDGKFAVAVEKTKALPPSGAKPKTSKPAPSNGDRDERHAIPPEEVETDARDTDSLTPPEGSRVRDTIDDASRSTPADDDDDDLDSVPPVSTESHNTGLRRRSPPKPNTVPPPADTNAGKAADKAPPTEPSPGTTLPPPSPGDGATREKRESFVEVVNPKSSAAADDTEAATNVDNPVPAAKPAEAPAPESFDVTLSEITKVTAAVPSTPAKPASEPTVEAGYPARERGALLLLALLQREGRFVDFLQQDVTDFDDEQVGAAARVVHEGCRRALKGHLEVSPIRSEAEGDKVTLDVGYDVHANKLVGNVTGKPPYKGSVQHRGWRAEHLELPKEVGDHDPSVLAQAEVEL